MARLEMGVLFMMGGFAYLGAELAWRGATHWTMFLAGGLCVCYLNWLNGLTQPQLPLLLCGALGALGVSGIELMFGLFCTRLLRLRVWDYSGEWGNVAGLVCPKYTVLWFFLCTWLLFALRLVRRMTLF